MPHAETANAGPVPTVSLDDGASASPEDQQLVDAIRKGGAARRRAIENLYTQQSERLFRFFLSKGVTREAAEDFVQETFLKALRKIDGYRYEGPFVAWLWRIAWNLFIDEQRRVRPHALAEDFEGIDWVDAEWLPASQNAYDDIALAQLKRCVAQRFESFREQHPVRANAIALAVLGDFPMASIAQIIGRNVGATREFISQSRSKLRSVLERCLSFIKD